MLTTAVKLLFRDGFWGKVWIPLKLPDPFSSDYKKTLKKKKTKKKNATSTEMNQVEKPPPSRTGISKASRFYATMKLFCREMLDVGSEGERAGRTPSVLS